MAQNLTINGVTYNGVESLSIPKSGGGNAVFTEGGGTYQFKTVTPSASQQNITPDMGYDALSAVTVNGDADLVAGNIKKDVQIFGVIGTLESGGGLPATIVAGDTPVLISTGLKSISATDYSSVGLSITILKAGTYRFKWSAVRESTSGTAGTQLLKNDVVVNTNTTFNLDNSYGQDCTYDLQCAAGDVIKLAARSRSSLSAITTNYLVACINWTTGF